MPRVPTVCLELGQHGRARWSRTFSLYVEPRGRRALRVHTVKRRRFLLGSGAALLTGLAGRAREVCVVSAMDLAEPSRQSNIAPATITLFLCGDVMTGRGIDQILPHPSNPKLYEPYVRSRSEELV